MKTQFGVSLLAICSLFLSLAACDPQDDRDAASDGSKEAKHDDLESSDDLDGSDDPPSESETDTEAGAEGATWQSAAVWHSRSPLFSATSIAAQASLSVAPADDGVVCATGAREESVCERINVSSPSGNRAACTELDHCEITEVMVLGRTVPLCRAKEARCQTMDLSDRDEASVCLRTPECKALPAELGKPELVCLPV